MIKVLVNRKLLERIARDDEGAASFADFEELKRVLAQPAEAEGVDLQRLADEFDAAPDDAEWEPPHPIFQMARDLDRVTAALSAVTAERDNERRRADVAVADANDAERERDQLRSLLTRVDEYLAAKGISRGATLRKSIERALSGQGAPE